MSRRVMCHVVAGYPSQAACLELMKGMSKLGVSAIEVQFPFSDPIADGEAIMEANDIAIRTGMTVQSSFEMIAKARSYGIKTDIYIMSYAQKILHFGWEEFCKKAEIYNVKGFIIPDLPYDSPEFGILHKLCSGAGIALVPVLSPGMSETRFAAVLAMKPSTIYLTSQKGITGNSFTVSQELRLAAEHIKRQSDSIVQIGFGVKTPQDVEAALKIADIAVVGSAIIKSLQSATVSQTLRYIKTLVDVPGQKTKKLTA